MNYMHDAVKFRDMMDVLDFSSIENFSSKEIKLELGDKATVGIIVKKRFNEGGASFDRTFFIDVEFCEERRVKMLFYLDCKIFQANFDFISSGGKGVSRKELLYRLDKMLQVAQRSNERNIHRQIKPLIEHLQLLFTQTHIFPGILSEEPVEPGARRFTVGDEWGPMQCEINNCGKETDMIILNEDENRLLPVKSGSDAVRFIFEHKLGVAICADCFTL